MRDTKPRPTARARALRKASTDAEKRLWSLIRNRQLGGAKFVRQEPIGPYIVDFVCRERRIIVEVDGGQHAESQADETRDAFLQSRGFRVLRFWNNEVLGNAEGVYVTIQAALTESSSHLESEER